MVSVKQLHESLNRLYEDVNNNNLIINIRRPLLNEDIEINWPEVIFSKSEVESAAYKALTDSGLSEEVIESIDLDYDTLVVHFDMYDAEWLLDEIQNDGGLYNVFLSIFNSYKLELEDLDESLTEAVNHENDEVNDVIRRNIGKRLKDISPEDRELLANNGVSISGGKDNRTYSIKDNRSMTFDKNGKTKEYSTHGLRKPSIPDVNNPDFDLKGWLSPNEKELKRLHGAKYKPLDHYKMLKSYADDAEKRGRRYRKDLEAQAQNLILDNDDYYPRVDYESRDRAIRGDYEWADRLNNKAKKVASDAKDRSKYYKNESLNESVVTINSEKYPEFIDAIGDIQNWIEDYEIDLQDVLYDVFNHPSESKFGDFIINLRNEYRDEE